MSDSRSEFRIVIRFLRRIADDTKEAVDELLDRATDLEHRLRGKAVDLLRDDPDEDAPARPVEEAGQVARRSAAGPSGG
ncbi:hypothetical protein [Kitasatospora sp. NPDC059327]|uniref:hypothetical protein n=1 Tax=Kitasatospora sp. NPDC059327 TaxID=3346803 RepID=UPI0036C58B3A